MKPNPLICFIALLLVPWLAAEPAATAVMRSVGADSGPPLQFPQNCFAEQALAERLWADHPPLDPRAADRVHAVSRRDTLLLKGESRFKTGQTVPHFKFGEGKVKTIKRGGEKDFKLVIAFKEFGEKVFLESAMLHAMEMWAEVAGLRSQTAWERHLANLEKPIPAPGLHTRIDVPLVARTPERKRGGKRWKEIDVLEAIFADDFDPRILKYLPSAPSPEALAPQPAYTPADIARHREKVGLAGLRDESLMHLGRRGEIPITMSSRKSPSDGRSYTRYRISPEVAMWLTDLVSLDQAAELLGVNHVTILKQLKIPGQAKGWGLVILWKQGDQWHPNERWFVSLERLTPLFQQRFHAIPVARAYRVLRAHGVAIHEDTLADWCRSPSAIVGDEEAEKLFGRAGALWNDSREIDLDIFARLARYLHRNQKLLDTGWKIEVLAKRTGINEMAFRQRVASGLIKIEVLPRRGSQKIYRISEEEANRVLGLSKAINSKTENLQALGIRRVRPRGWQLATADGWDLRRLLQMLRAFQNNKGRKDLLLDQIAWFFDETLHLELVSFIQSKRPRDRASERSEDFQTLLALADRLVGIPQVAELRAMLISAGARSFKEISESEEKRPVMELGTPPGTANSHARQKVRRGA